jgi:hypothetical protein
LALKNVVMRIQGTVYDSSNRPLGGVTVQIKDFLTGQILFNVGTTNNDGQYYIDVTNPTGDESISFFKQGYEGAYYMLTQRLYSGQNGDVVLNGGNSFPMWLKLAALVAIFAYIKKNNKVGKLDKTDIQNIMLATAGLLGFSLIKQLLEFLGIWQDREGQQLDDAATNPNSFWNPNFWRTKPDYVPWTAPITDTDAQATAKFLYNAISWTGDDEDGIKGIFRQFRAQSTVSYVAAWFLQLYQKDLLSYLRTGVPPTNGLSDAELSEINSFISKLPKY